MVPIKPLGVKLTNLLHVIVCHLKRVESKI